MPKGTEMLRQLLILETNLILELFPIDFELPFILAFREIFPNSHL